MTGTEPFADKEIRYNVVTSTGEHICGNLNLKDAARAALTFGSQEYRIRGAYQLGGGGPKWLDVLDEETLASLRKSWVADQREQLVLGCRVTRVESDAADTAGFLMVTPEGRAAWARTDQSLWGRWDEDLWLITLEDGRVFSPSCDYRLWVRNPSVGRNDWRCTCIWASVELSESLKEAETAVFQRIVFGDEWSEIPSVKIHN